MKYAEPQKYLSLCRITEKLIKVNKILNIEHIVLYPITSVFQNDLPFLILKIEKYKQYILYKSIHIIPTFQKLNYSKIPLLVLMQMKGMISEHTFILQDRVKALTEFSMIPLLVVKSSVVSLLQLPQRPERQTDYNYKSNWIMRQSS